VTVVGSRFEGKTTLLRIAAGLEQPDSGTVWFAGRELTGLALAQRERLWRDEIAWVSREGSGLEFEVLEYVALALRVGRRRSSDAEESAMAALERVGVRDVAGRRLDELSNWERVLVTFARAIAKEPRLIVMDDVFDGLGASKTREAGELLCALVQELGCGVLMSASDPEAALLADRVWAFDGCRLKLLSDQTIGDADVIDFPEAAGKKERQISCDI